MSLLNETRKLTREAQAEEGARAKAAFAIHAAPYVAAIDEVTENFADIVLTKAQAGHSTWQYTLLPQSHVIVEAARPAFQRLAETVIRQGFGYRVTSIPTPGPRLAITIEISW
jgi:hypothetical protein